MSMKKNFLRLMMLCLSMVLLSTTSHATSTHDIYGKPYHFSVPPGKWVIINYWATWCPYCAREIPELNKLAKALQTMPAIFFGVNYDNASDQEQQAFAASHAINYVLLHDNPYQELLGDQPVSSLPTTFIISPTGQVQVIRGELRASDIMDSIR